jgi:hypothetical protein
LAAVAQVWVCSTAVIEIAVRGSQLELEGYSTDATVAELWRALEAKRRAPRLKTVSCYDCGECCHDPVPLLGVSARTLVGGNPGLC